MELSKMYILVTDIVGRQLIGWIPKNSILSVNNEIELFDPMLFSEQPSQSPDGSVQIGLVVRPIFLSEHVDVILIKPATIYQPDPDGKIMEAHHRQSERIEQELRMARSGLTLASSMPGRPPLVTSR